MGLEPNEGCLECGGAAVNRISKAFCSAMVAYALIACGSEPSPGGGGSPDAASDSATDGAQAKTEYCYEFGGPSSVEPDAGDAGINPNVCDAGGRCVQVTGQPNWFCFYPDGGR